jgi:uncharacterized membrane protein YsdA (DUF1294 family)/cold shock CspA family protein
MRKQGRISSWDDDRGFGFVSHESDGRIFVHIHAFEKGQGYRRPINGDLISYVLLRDDKNRIQARQVKFIERRQFVSKKPELKSDSMNWTECVVLCCVFIYLMMRLPQLIVMIYGVMSLLTFIAYALDKSAAQSGQWRTKEDTLHSLAILGGWPGAYLAQKYLRHKSQKKSFLAEFWTTVVVNCVLALLYLNMDTITIIFKFFKP